VANILLDIVDGGRANRPTTSYATQTRLPTSQIPADSFSASAVQRAWAEFVLPWYYRAAATLMAEVEWCSSSTSADKECRWNLSSAKIVVGGSLDSISLGSDDSAEPTDSTTAYGRNRTQITLANQPASLVAGDRVRVEFERDPTSANDDLANPALAVRYSIYMVV
jgi:hypothetical protein